MGSNSGRAARWAKIVTQLVRGGRQSSADLELQRRSLLRHPGDPPRRRDLEVLARLVERFEREVAEPLLLDPEYGARVAPGTVGLRIPVSRFVCKRKLSQDKDVETRKRVIAALREPGPYHHPGLADEMEAAPND